MDVDMRKKQAEELETSTVKHKELFRGNQEILNWFINNIQNTIKIIRHENKKEQKLLVSSWKEAIKTILIKPVYYI